LPRGARIRRPPSVARWVNESSLDIVKVDDLRSVGPKPAPALDVAVLRK
jgi:hypothetical protein